MRTVELPCITTTPTRSPAHTNNPSHHRRCRTDIQSTRAVDQYTLYCICFIFLLASFLGRFWGATTQQALEHASRRDAVSDLSLGRAADHGSRSR